MQKPLEIQGFSLSGCFGQALLGIVEVLQLFHEEFVERIQGLTGARVAARWPFRWLLTWRRP
jgi:hypothetical protein